MQTGEFAKKHGGGGVGRILQGWGVGHQPD